MAGCAEELTGPDMQGDGIKVTAGFAETKTIFVEENKSVKVHWEYEDKIGIFTDSQSNLEYSAGSSGASTSFKAAGDALEASEGTVAYAYYPYSSTAHPDDYVVDIIGNAHSYNYDNWAYQDFIYASGTVSSGKLDLKFKHFYSFIKLTLPIKLLDSTLYALGLESPAHNAVSINNATFNIKTGELTQGNGYYNLFYYIPEAQLVGDTITCYIPILPQTAGEIIRIYNIHLNEDETWNYGDCLVDKTVPSGGFEAGKMYSVNLTEEEVEEMDARDVLIALYNSTGGDNWTNNENWCSDKPISEWYGVKYYPEYFTLDLGGNNLTGILPKEIGYLKDLKSLRLNSNKLEGSLPSKIWTLTNLQELVLYSNNFSGSIPPEVGDMINLINLDLQSNNFSGTIPKEIGNLTKLEILYLDYNEFTGTIPSEIGNLTNLGALYLGGSSLTGKIPESLGNCTNLRTLSINNTPGLTGNIPETIFDLKSLSYLYLDGNSLSGEIPSGISKLMNSDYIRIYNNDFSGPVPSAVQQHSNWCDLWPTFLYQNTGLDLTDLYIPAKEFSVTDVNGNTVSSETEYTKNKYTIIYQWSVNNNYTHEYIDDLKERYDQWKENGAEIITWCQDTYDGYLESFNQIRAGIPWKQLAYKTRLYPYSLYNGFVAVADQNGEIVFESITGDPYELFDFIDEKLGTKQEIFSISTDKVTVPVDGGSFDITVTANISHRITNKPSWVAEINLTSDPANGTWTHTFTAEPNTTGAIRYGYITISSESSDKSYTVTIKQEAAADDWKNKEFYHRSTAYRFTGTWCGACPYMAKTLASAQEELPNKLEVISYYLGGGPLDLSTCYNLYYTFGVNYVPFGMIDGRREGNSVSLIKEIVSETESTYPTSAGISFSSSLSDRNLSIDVKLYLKKAETYKITALVVEDAIVSPQAGESDNYVHNNVARIVLTNILGDQFTVSQANSTKNFTYSTSIPSEYNLDNCRIVVYVQRKFGNQTVIQSGSYGDYYIDNVASCKLGENVLLKYAE